MKGPVIKGLMSSSSWIAKMRAHIVRSLVNGNQSQPGEISGHPMARCDVGDQLLTFSFRKLQ